MAKNVIEDLIETVEDGRKGFEKTAERLRKDGYADLASQMSEYSEQRARFASELREAAARGGFEIDEDGSIAGALHRGWIALSDALTGDDPAAVLSAAEAGEDHAVDEYEDALEDDELTGEMRGLVARQASEVKQTHDRVRALRDGFES